MIRSQFSYCSLIWMFSSRNSNNLISKVHERSLRIISGDNHSSFKSLLSKCKEITIHQRDLQVLMTETYKIKKIHVASEIFKKYLMGIEKQ